MFEVDAGIAAWFVAAYAAIEAVLREVLPSIWMLLLSFVLIMQWHALPLFPDDDRGDEKRSLLAGFRGRFADRPDLGNANALVVGLNILAFHLFFTPRLRKFTSSAPFVFFFLVIFYITYVLYRVRNRLALCAGLLKDKRMPKVASEYMDFSGKVSRAVILGIAQFTLMVYYVVSLYQVLLKRPDLDTMSCLTWALGVVVILAATPKTGKPFDMGRWDYIELSYRWIVSDWTSGGDGRDWRTGRFGLVPGGEKLSEHVEASSTPSSSKVFFRKELQEIWFRMGPPPVQNIPTYFFFKFVARKHMDFTINAFSRLIILSTAPILFSLSAAIESLKKSVAIFFIVTLDDLATRLPVDAMLDRFVEKYGPEAQAARVF